MARDGLSASSLPLPIEGLSQPPHGTWLCCAATLEAPVQDTSTLLHATQSRPHPHSCTREIIAHPLCTHATTRAASWASSSPSKNLVRRCRRRCRRHPCRRRRCCRRRPCRRLLKHSLRQQAALPCQPLGPRDLDVHLRSRVFRDAFPRLLLLQLSQLGGQLLLQLPPLGCVPQLLVHHVQREAEPHAGRLGEVGGADRRLPRAERHPLQGRRPRHRHPPVRHRRRESRRLTHGLCQADASERRLYPRRRR